MITLLTVLCVISHICMISSIFGLASFNNSSFVGSSHTLTLNITLNIGFERVLKVM